ncbi:adenylate kinase 7-like [Salarias fasciatus]|uniref:adenylate kinase 7-like n=1 Tax=Salarias fasciatus TaxID=181472 RepID=UPI0011768DB6|nr:adenylate kinase 7-like [Salarias fasciatus]
MGKSKQAPRRVFINRIDSYASRNIAKLLCECGVDTAGDASEDLDGETEPDQTESGGFQVVGTVSDQSEEEWPFVLEKYFQPDKGDLLAKLLSCDVIIYNISQHADQVEEGFWAASALHNEMGHFSEPKVFILISTVMTWACSKSPGPDEPELLTDESFRSRKAHRNFKTHIDLEKKVVKLGKTNKAVFSTYVVASGLQYGMGEQVFHYFFKTSWMGEEHEIPVFGDGNNFVPTIHISDLARVVQNVIEHRPEPQYLLAVDSSSCTLGDIVKAVAAELGPGKICKKPFEEAFLIKDLSVMEIDSMLVNLRLSAAHIETLFSINWLCQSGLVENIDLVAKEYRQERELLPVRVCVLGPPAVGKSTACKAICEHYRLHYISLKDAEIIPQEGVNSDPENHETLSSLKHTDQNEGVLDDQLKMLNEKLQSNPCRNQGFVLDGFPETYEQAKEFFYDEEDGTSKIVPEFVLCLDASDDFLIDRVINLPESVVQKHNYEQEHLLRRLAEYRKNADADPVINYFLEMDVAPLHLEIGSSSEPDWGLLMQKVYDTLGQPKNYSSTREEEEEEELRKAEERLRREAQDKEEEERWKEEEARCREARWKEWTEKQEVVRQQEEELLEAQSLSTRNYLLEHVMPTLTQGLAECCAVRPENPVEFLAEYLFKNNPSDY